MEGPSVIRCDGVTKAFGTSPVVSDVSLAIRPGEVMVLVGPSGSGKTTLLRLVAGFEVPDGGSILLEDKLMFGAGTWVPPEDRHLGMVFQDYALFPHLKVSENVAFGLKGWSKEDRSSRAHEMLAMVHLDRMTERYPYQLSGGEQQRVALARSLAPSPLALLLDEPLSNLDPQLRAQLRREVKSVLASNGVTALYVTHDQDEALYIGDRVAVMNGGKLEQIGTPEEIFHRPASRFVAGFLGLADFMRGTFTAEGLQTEIGFVKIPTSVETGTDVDVMVRPDDIAIHPAESGNGRINARIFRGMHYLYNVTLQSGTMLHSIQSHAVYYEEGDTVEVSLEPRQMLSCFMADRSQSATEKERTFQVFTGDGGSDVA